jgi:hypothetical protein
LLTIEGRVSGHAENTKIFDCVSDVDSNDTGRFGVGQHRQLISSVAEQHLLNLAVPRTRRTQVVRRGDDGEGRFP